jgi:hypothetical protein
MMWPSTSFTHHSPAAGCQRRSGSGNARASAANVAAAPRSMAATSSEDIGRGASVIGNRELRLDRGPAQHKKGRVTLDSRVTRPSLNVAP